MAVHCLIFEVTTIFLLHLFDQKFGGDLFFQNIWLTFSGLQGIMPQKIQLLMTTAVRTLNSTSGYK
jgi:hypothetical protein